MNKVNNLTLAALTLSILATAGSLFFSEVMEFVPCILCWYQRIAMYPLVAIFTIGFLTEDQKSFIYAAPFILAGLLISIYHNLIQLEIIPETITPCREGISCAAKYIEWFGFVTIPLLSFVTFMFLTIILYQYFKTRTKNA